MVEISARFSDLSSFLVVDIAALLLALVAAIVVPSSLTPIVVVPQNQSIDSSCIALCVLDSSHPVELLSNCSLDDLILLILVQFGSMVEMKLVIVEVRHYHLGLLHVDADGQDALEREVRILDVFPVDFFVFVE